MLNIKVLSGWFSRAALLNPTFICSGLIQEPPLGTKVAAGCESRIWALFWENSVMLFICSQPPKAAALHLESEPQSTSEIVLVGGNQFCFLGCTCGKNVIFQSKRTSKEAPSSKSCVCPGWMCVLLFCVLQWHSWRCSSWEFSPKGRWGLSWHCWSKSEGERMALRSVSVLCNKWGETPDVYQQLGGLWGWHLIDGLGALHGLPLLLRDALWCLLKSEQMLTITGWVFACKVTALKLIRGATKGQRSIFQRELEQ